MRPVCVVGGGPAGLAMARNLVAHRVPCVVLERHSDVGGLWDQNNPGSPVYDSAHFISSKSQSHFHDFEMPAEYPDYPSQRQILDYMYAFTDAYALRQHIRFDTAVERAESTGDGWRVTTADGEVLDASNLVCANGTNWHAVMPHYPGTFTGELRHAQTYRSMSEFAGKRVLIIGAGNSGCDIACDAAQSADAAYISMRRGYHFIPKHIFGIPSDEFAASGPHLPMWVEQRVFGLMLKAINGNTRRLGLPKPDHRLFETHPILNTQLLHFLSHGDITAKPDIARFEGSTVHFTDGTSVDVDVILCATGYEWRIPYVDHNEFTWRHGRPDLYMNLFSRTNPRLFALGFMETNGGAYKLFDEMADLITRTIVAREQGRSAAVDGLIATDRPDLTGGIRFVDSARHATYVESAAYRRQMQRMRRSLGWPALSPGCFDRLRKVAA